MQNILALFTIPIEHLVRKSHHDNGHVAMIRSDLLVTPSIRDQRYVFLCPHMHRMARHSSRRNSHHASKGSSALAIKDMSFFAHIRILWHVTPLGETHTTSQKDQVHGGPYSEMILHNREILIHCAARIKSSIIMNKNASHIHFASQWTLGLLYRQPINAQEVHCMLKDPVPKDVVVASGMFDTSDATCAIDVAAYATRSICYLLVNPALSAYYIKVYDLLLKLFSLFLTQVPAKLHLMPFLAQKVSPQSMCSPWSFIATKSTFLNLRSSPCSKSICPLPSTMTMVFLTFCSASP